MLGLTAPVDYSFAIGETFAPPPFLWQVCQSGCWVPVNLTEFSAVFTARQTPFSDDPPTIQATTENGMLVVSGFQGSIQLVLPAALTSQLFPVELEWDLWVYSPTYVPDPVRLVGGKLIVYQGVTRP